MPQARLRRKGREALLCLMFLMPLPLLLLYPPLPHNLDPVLPTSSMPGIDREKALRPILHNATTISVQPAPLPVPVSRPLVHELYAQAFALLPTIHTFYGLLTQKAKSLYDYLFNPAVTIFPAGEVDTATELLIFLMIPCPTPLLVKPLSRPWKSPLHAQLVADASFDDPGRLSAPEIQPSDYTLLTHWMHLPSTPLCLVLPMNSSTFFTINFLHTFFICSRPNAVAELFPRIYCWPS